MSTTPAPGSRQLPRQRLRLVSSDAARLVAIGTGIGVVLLLIGVASVVIAMLRPVIAPIRGDAATPPTVRVPTPPDSTAASSTLASLRSDNPFSPGRLGFAFARPRPAEMAEPEGSAADRAPPAPTTPTATTESPTGEVIVLNDLNAVADDVRMAYLNLTLNAIFVHPGYGDRTAMIAFNDKGPDHRPILVPEGGEFTDPAHARASWSIRRIDMVRGRAIVSRSGANLALELFTNRAPRPAVALSSAQSDEDAILRIEQRTEAEIIAELRAAGATESEIEYLMAEMAQIARLGEDAPRAAPLTREAVDRIASDAPGLAGLGTPAAAPPDAEPVFGMAELLQMMGTGRNPIEMQEQAERRRREREQQPDS